MTTRNSIPILVLFAAMLAIFSCKKSNDLAVAENKENSTNIAAGLLTPEEVTIEAHSQKDCPTPGSCLFTASGAINDAGTIESESIFWTAVPSPVVGTAHWVRSFIGQHGSITIQVQVVLHATVVPYLAQESEHWIILSGTGDYQGLQGEGDATGIRNFLESKLDVVYTGLVH